MLSYLTNFAATHSSQLQGSCMIVPVDFGVMFKLMMPAIKACMRLRIAGKEMPCRLMNRRFIDSDTSEASAATLEVELAPDRWWRVPPQMLGVFYNHSRNIYYIAKRG